MELERIAVIRSIRRQTTMTIPLTTFLRSWREWPDIQGLGCFSRGGKRLHTYLDFYISFFLVRYFVEVLFARHVTFSAQRLGSTPSLFTSSHASTASSSGLQHLVSVCLFAWFTQLSFYDARRWKRCRSERWIGMGSCVERRI